LRAAARRRRADAARVHLAPAQRVPGRHAEDMRPGEHHAPHASLPCPLPPRAGAKYGAAAFTGVLGGARRLLAGGGAASDYCQRKV